MQTTTKMMHFLLIKLKEKEKVKKINVKIMRLLFIRKHTPSRHLTLGLGIPLALQVRLMDEPYSTSTTDRFGDIKLGGINRSNFMLVIILKC
jgi:hypothetical protein